MTGILDLGNEKDVADFLLRKRGEPGPVSEGGYESAASSASSAAGDDADAISLADDYVGRNNKKGQKKAVKLDEVGPRMELRLVKITEGAPGKEGAVIYHGFGKRIVRDHRIDPNALVVKKSKAEVAALKMSHAAKERLRKQRREEQEENVRRKKEAKQKGPNALPEEASDNRADGSEDEEEYGEDGVGWDEEDEISDVNDDSSTDSEQESEEELVQPPLKKTKVSVKR